MAKSITIAGIGRVSNIGCSKSKKRAASMAKKIREKGNTARVIKQKNGSYCVYKGRKSKVRAKKK